MHRNLPGADAVSAVGPWRRSGTALALLTALAAVVLFGCSNHGSLTAPEGGPPPADPGAGLTFNSGALTGPASFVHSFQAEGTIPYHCTFHVFMGMVGTIVVEAAGADSVVVMAGGTTFTPAEARVKPGGYVHWLVTAGVHTVTSDSCCALTAPPGTSTDDHLAIRPGGHAHPSRWRS